jgi:hypothetical protein
MRSEQFQDRVAEHLEKIRRELVKTGIGNVVQRVQRQSKTWNDLQFTIQERAERLLVDEDGEPVPGASTGLVVRQYKVIGTGPAAQQITEYKVDHATLKSLLDLEKQTAEELGQLITKTDLTTNGEKIETVIILPPNGR